MKSILATYEAASGQAISSSKSEFFFSKNVGVDVRQSLSSLPGVSESLGSDRYLRLPYMIGRKKKSTFNYLKDRVWRKLISWRGKALSRAGREVLVKSVIQAITSFCMNVFLLPPSLGEEIERMMNCFWWGSNRRGVRGISWLRWDKMIVRRNLVVFDPEILVLLIWQC